MWDWLLGWLHGPLRWFFTPPESPRSGRVPHVIDDLQVGEDHSEDQVTHRVKPPRRRRKAGPKSRRKQPPR
jgi:hypothetical protein